jgi:hypothetical protein
MKPTTTEDLLWDLPPRPDEPAEMPADERLIAYREGRLDDAEAEALEALLARHGAARERLVALAGVTLDAPSPALRDRVLERLAPRQHRARRWVAAAAIVAAAVLGTLWLDRDARPPLPRVTVELTGLRGERGGEAPRNEVPRAFPTTAVEIAGQVIEGEADGVELAVYRREADVLVRVTAPQAPHRGRFLIRADAAALASEQRGPVTLWIVLGAAGDLPERIDGGDSDPGSNSGELLADDGRRVVFERTLQIDDP